jgi:hypothetical protein
MLKIKFGQEIPVGYVEDLHKYDDIGFIIAPYLVQHPEYAADYVKYYSHNNKRILIDNGAYEFRKYPQIQTLIDAVQSVTTHTFNDVWLILPDDIGRMKSTLSYTLITKSLLRDAGVDFNLCAVVQGSSVEEMWMCYQYLVHEGFQMVALPFLSNRPQFLQEKGYLMSPDVHVHLLGSYGIDEIIWLRHQQWKFQMSIDTSKALKAAINWKYITDYERTDSDKKWDPNIALTQRQRFLLRANSSKLHKVCMGRITDQQLSLMSYKRPESSTNTHIF